MAKIPRLSGKEFIAVMQRMGFHVARQKGSHVALRRGSQGCVIPLHRELRVGTLVGALR